VSFWGATLDNADLSQTDLTKADFSFSHANAPVSLNTANLSGAHMGRAILPQADFTSAYFNNTDLHDASLTKADFRNAIFEGCSDARGTDFTAAVISPEQLKLVRTDHTTKPPKTMNSFKPSTPLSCPPK
jgi:uncharacterized protein YjbI with pentapeptide repeats